ncbi:hypothetical protein VSDG_00137 [Cytospora chrysosperma]|uniref:Mitochondrial inner membrane protease subunit 2 n=1 Tax=Cytospora chrysosperma TaxID=252740 RepID=A0A423WP68_CYTCH|nr:hypothetical protein VSDG_00137 [Valsa sordida]
MAVGSAWTRFRGTASFARANFRYIFLSLTWAPVLLFIDKHVVGTTRIEGPSMYPYLNDRYNQTRWGDVCLTWKLYAQEGLQRGMIVTFHNPLKPEALTVKRIVGLPGDLVHTRPPFPNSFIRVPPNHIWVEGDGTNTIDSNTFGPISIRLIEGRLTHILWPFQKAQRVKWWEHPDRLASFRE